MSVEVESRLFSKAFKTIANFDVVPKVKEHLLKIRHALSGTNKLLAQIDPSKVDHCTFCKIKSNSVNRCDTGGIERVLFGCIHVEKFMWDLVNSEPFRGSNISMDEVHRLVYQEISNSSQQITNQTQMLIPKLKSCQRYLGV